MVRFTSDLNQIKVRHGSGLNLRGHARHATDQVLAVAPLVRLSKPDMVRLTKL